MERGVCTSKAETEVSFSETVSGIVFTGKATVGGRVRAEYVYTPARITADPYYSEPSDTEIDNLELAGDVEVEIGECSPEPTEAQEQELMGMIGGGVVAEQALIDTANGNDDWIYD